MSAYAFYGATLALLLLSYLKNKQKTKQALKKSWKSFENILPQFLAILLLIGFMLALVDEQTISGIVNSV